MRMMRVSWMSIMTSSYLLALFQNRGFHDVENDFRLPTGPTPEPGFHDVKTDFRIPTVPTPELGFDD
eukprot:12268983-Prorocentrum_lima.AAC.1